MKQLKYEKYQPAIIYDHDDYCKQRNARCNMVTLCGCVYNGSKRQKTYCATTQKKI